MADCFLLAFLLPVNTSVSTKVVSPDGDSDTHELQISPRTHGGGACMTDTAVGTTSAAAPAAAGAGIAGGGGSGYAIVF